MSNFKRLCEITEEEIDFSKVSNQTLCKILATSKKGEYIFSSRRKGHIDYTEEVESGSTHEDQISRYSSGWHYDTFHTDQMVSSYEKRHKDHEDHNDTVESLHRDNNYREASYHTDSDGGHKDHTERSHKDS